MGEKMYSCVKAVLRKSGKVLFLKQESPRGWYLDLPGGRLNIGEDPHAALVREVREETGLKIRLGPAIGMYYFLRTDGDQVTATVFEATATNSVGKIVVEAADKITGFMWLTPKQALRQPLVHPSFKKFLKSL